MKNTKRIHKYIKTAVALLAPAITFTASAVTAHFEGFEDPAWVQGDPANWNNSGGSINRATSGTGGIASKTGVAHATVTGSAFTRFGGYSSDFGSGFSTSLDIYLDTTWSNGLGFDFSSASSNQAGNHLRDWIWHVGMVNGSLLVNASNNTTFAFNQFKLETENGGNYATIGSSGWYTFENKFYDAGGNLYVDYNLYGSGGALVHTITRGGTDPIATDVGGNRYGWLTYNSIDRLAIDNTTLSPVSSVPDFGSTALLLSVSLLSLAFLKRRR